MIKESVKFPVAEVEKLHLLKGPICTLVPSKFAACNTNEFGGITDLMQAVSKGLRLVVINPESVNWALDNSITLKITF